MESRSFISVYILNILLLILPQREMSTRNISWGVKVAGAYSWQPYNLHVQIVLKCGSLSFLEPSGLFQVCKKISLPLLFILNADMYYIIYTAAHPNIRLFITHGGQLSKIEAITRGVPVVGIPVYADQRRNMALAELAVYGLLIDFNNITTESLTWAIQETIESPKYVLLFSLQTIVYFCL